MSNEFRPESPTIVEGAFKTGARLIDRGATHAQAFSVVADLIRAGRPARNGDQKEITGEKAAPPSGNRWRSISLSGAKR